MDKMTQILDIPSIKNDTNFWMVRAKRGFFFDEFIRNEFIAIGWNSVTKAMISQNLTRSQSDRLKASIKATYDESKPGTSLNKCIRFCYELKAGDIAQENAFPLLICYMAIFGGKAGDYEFHSIIGVIKGIINHKYDEDKKKIELRKLSAEADLAEQQALKQKLENIETMRRLQLSSVDAYAEPLATAAKNLAVQPSSATIIDITKILKSQQEDQPPQ